MNASNFVQTPWNDPFIPQRADPYILHEEGKYYFTASVPDYDRIVLRSSDTLEGLRDAAEKTLWTCHETGEMSKHIWAPELHRKADGWYIYFAAGRKERIWKIRPYVLKCTGSDPMRDPWMEMGMMKRADKFSFNDFSLDMTVFSHRGRSYTVWAEKVNQGKKISNLYIAETDSPLSLKTPQVLLSSPSYDWERIGFWVNEGPAFLEGKDHVYISYSASSTGENYCMGMLTAPAGEDLLDPDVWRKSRTPVLASDSTYGLYGPGHNCFFRDDCGQTIMAFHARPYDRVTGDPLYDPNRHCYLMKIDWQEDRPVFSYDNLLR